MKMPQPYIGAQIGFLQLKGTNFNGKTYGFSPKFSAGFDLPTMAEGPASAAAMVKAGEDAIPETIIRLALKELSR